MSAGMLQGGFDDPSRDSALAFRGIMTAMARPGRIMAVTGAAAPPPLSPAAATVLLTLCDTTTPLSLAPGVDTPDLRAWLAFHTGAPLSPPERAAFALGGWADLTPLDRYPAGSPDYPDRSATLIVECTSLTDRGATLRGPGIRDSARLSLPETQAFQQNARRFPMGLDFILTCGTTLAALPRTTKVS